MSVDKSKIVDRIAKLMMLGQSDNENESLNAIRKAQELMSEWSITQTEIDVATGEKPAYFKQSINLSQGNFKGWERSLLYIIANANFCRVLFTLKSSHVTMYGTQFDTEMTITLYQFVRVQMVALADFAFEQVKGQTSLHGKKWKNSYFEGMLVKISESILNAQKTIEQKYDKYEIVPLQQRQNTQSYALVVREKNRQVEQFFRENSGPVRSISRRVSTNNDAFRRGYQDGSKVALG